MSKEEVDAHIMPLLGASEPQQSQTAAGDDPSFGIPATGTPSNRKKPKPAPFQKRGARFFRNTPDKSTAVYDSNFQ